MFRRLKAVHYREAKTCARLGAAWWDRLRLAGATLEFHGANLAGPADHGTRSAAGRYRVRLQSGTRDLWLRRRSGDIFILHEVFTFAAYRIPYAWLGRVRTVVDLGANVGLTTLYFSQLFPAARYVCVEPNPANADLLRRNTAWMGLRAEVVEAAVGSRSGQVLFDDSGWSWGGHVAEAGQPGRPVRCCTLDEIVSASDIDHIDLLKVDVEGAEREVLRSSASSLRKVGMIVIELHGDYGLADFARDVVPLGFTVVPPGSPAGNTMPMAVAADVLRAAQQYPGYLNEQLFAPASHA
jgi:FkbM family methyltransferase